MKNSIGLVGALVVVAIINGCSSGDGAGSGPASDAATDTNVSTDTATSDTPTGDSVAIDTTASDTKASDTAATDSPTDGGSCTALAAPTCNAVTMPAGAPSVTEVVGTVPTVTGGGVIPDGSYVLTKRIIESGPPKTLKEVNVYAGACIQTFNQDPDGDNRANGTFSWSGSDGTIKVTCPVTTITAAVTFRVDTTGPKAKLFTRSETPKIYNEWLQQ